MKYFQTAFRDFRNEMRLEAKCFPRLFVGSLFGTRRSAIGQVLSLSLVTVPVVFAKVNSAQVPSRFKVANEYRNVSYHPSTVSAAFIARSCSKCEDMSVARTMSTTSVLISLSDRNNDKLQI